MCPEIEVELSTKATQEEVVEHRSRDPRVMNDEEIEQAWAEAEYTPQEDIREDA
ncbi:MAG TPA: hypothetical protein VJ742_11925 [Nitrososphaera sp.]|nr:hypothetical protein [Nitrososphaera sp.]